MAAAHPVMPRIAVVVVVPAPHDAALQLHRERAEDPLADVVVPHLTLLPPMQVKASRWDAVPVHLAAVAGATAPFPLRLAGSADFLPASRTVYVPVVAGADSLRRLEERVRSGPLRRHLPFPFEPHVTVAQELPDEQMAQVAAALAGFDATFTVDGLDLFVEGDDRVWRSARHFGFGVPV